MSEEVRFEEYDEPAGGWGSLKSLGSILLQEHVALHGARVLMQQNKPDGYACVSCAWVKPAVPHRFEFCENGAKATAWEITAKRAPPAFFLEHPVRELERWSDHDLEEQGRLTAPLRWDATSDRYIETTWEAAFEEIARELHAIAPKEAVFYTSGRASLEASYLYQLMVRMYGCNNLPDSSNMCHETTSVALPKTIGAPIGTVTLEDFDRTDCIFFFGQNVGTSSPRMLHQLQDARRRGVPIVTFNPLREPGLLSFANPQSPVEMLTTAETQISTQYHQVRAGGDAGALLGICKALIESDDERQRRGSSRVLDAAFIAEHTHGFEAFAGFARSTSWTDIENASGLGRDALRAAAEQYAEAHAVIAIYGMGLTQDRNGVDTGKANFVVPTSLDADPDMTAPGGDVLRLITLRSNDQFNTTVYGYDDRFRGIYGTRRVLMMHTDDIARLGLRDGDLVVAATVADDMPREVSGLRVTPHDIPRGCAAGCYPECNPLLPLWHYAAESKVPAAKSIPMRVRKTAEA